MSLSICLSHTGILSKLQNISSNVFDVIDHSILATKLEQLNLLSCILKWIGSFLTGRYQQVNYLNLISTPKPINRSIVQGSGIGPTLYIVMEGDVRALSRFNIIFKYADYTNLLVPEHTDIDLATISRIFWTGLKTIVWW